MDRLGEKHMSCQIKCIPEVLLFQQSGSVDLSSVLNNVHTELLEHILYLGSNTTYMHTHVGCTIIRLTMALTQGEREPNETVFY